MTHLFHTSNDRLRAALERVEGKRPTQRIVAGIVYKNGVSQSELAEWFGVERKTIYNWLCRLDEEPLETTVTDEERPGRPRMLDAEQRSVLLETLRAPPEAAGFDAPAWTPPLVRSHVREAYAVDYSLPSCRRLLTEAGLRYEAAASADGGDSGGSGGSRGGSGGGWIRREWRDSSAPIDRWTARTGADARS